MPIPSYQQTLADQEQAPGNIDNPNGGLGGLLPPGSGGGSPNPQGTYNTATKKWVTVNWTYTETEPAGACTGFEVAVFAGSSIEASNSVLAVPIEFIDDPAARQYKLLLELRTQVNLRSAVRACYGDFRSAWINATATAQFQPNTTDKQSDSGSLTMPDGTIMQWFRSGALIGQQDHTIYWPTPFPNELYCMTLTTEELSGNAGNDSWLVLRSKSTTQVTVYKQSTRDQSNNMPLRAYVVGWGR